MQKRKGDREVGKQDFLIIQSLKKLLYGKE